MVFKKLFKLFKRAFGIKSRKRRKKRSMRKKKNLHKYKAVKKGINRKRRGVLKKKKVLKKRVFRKKVNKSKIAKKPKIRKEVSATKIGIITHYFAKVNAAVIKLRKPLAIGEPIWIKGNKTNFKQTVGSMQIDRVAIEKGRAGQEIGLEVFKEVRPNDVLYLLNRKG